MLKIGYTSSGKEIYHQNVEEWLDQMKMKNIELTDEDIFQAFCLMNHMLTYWIRERDPRVDTSATFAETYESHLVDNLLWEKLLQRWNVSIPLQFAKLGKRFALLEFN